MAPFTREQAEFISKLIGYADHGCSICVGSLIDIFNRHETGWKFECGEAIGPNLDDDREESDGWPNEMRIVVTAKPR